MQVRRVYVEFVTQSDQRFEQLRKWSDTSSALYNKALQIALTANETVQVQSKAGHFYGQRMNYYDLYAMAKTVLKEEYSNCPEGQEVLKAVAQDLDSYWKAMAAYSKSPSKFTGKPKKPNLKTRGHVVTWPAPDRGGKLRSKGAKQTFYRPRTANLRVNLPWHFLGDIVYNQVRFVPKLLGFNIEVVYTLKVEQTVENTTDDFLALDPGVVNLYAGVTSSGKALLVKGGKIGYLNKCYNRRIDAMKSKLHRSHSSKAIKRHWQRLENRKADIVHNQTKSIVAFCFKHGISKIVIGQNKRQKDGRYLKWFNKMNHARVAEILKYKAEAVGIQVTFTEESYTSKTDNLAKQFLPSIEKKDKPSEWTPEGSRNKRGLYDSSTGVLINADVNGAIGIARKVFGDDWITKQNFCNPVQLTNSVCYRAETEASAQS